MPGVPHPCPHALGAERGTPAPKAVGGVSEPAACTRETSACTPSPAPLASLLVIPSLPTARAGAGGLAAGGLYSCGRRLLSCSLGLPFGATLSPDLIL